MPENNQVPEQGGPRKRISCYKCVHYFVTWDNAHRHGCRALGFKTSEMPSMVVWRSSGIDCLYFQARQATGKN